jgi:hypothetical protein
MAATSRTDDLTIPELLNALKQRLRGITASRIRCVVLLIPWRTCARVTLTCTVSSISSGLDLQEVRKAGNGIVDRLSTAPFR